MRVTYDELNKMVDNFAISHTWASNFFVVLKQGYTEKEMSESPYELQVLEWQCNCIDLIWETDWWEGEEYIDLFGIYTDEDFLELIGANSQQL